MDNAAHFFSVWSVEFRLCCPDIVEAVLLGRMTAEEGMSAGIGRLRRCIAGMLRKFGRRNDEDAVSDILSATMLRLATMGIANRIDMQRGSPMTFVVGVMRLVILELYRTKRRETQADDIIIMRATANEPAPHEVLADEERLEQMRRAYLQLSERQQDALLLNYPWLDPYRISKAVPGRKADAARHRALKRLRELLKFL